MRVCVGTHTLTLGSSLLESPNYTLKYFLWSWYQAGWTGFFFQAGDADTVSWFSVL